MSWDPDQYLRFADERALPFFHLLAAIGHLRPHRILDVGCGPGALTATLLERWPAATIVGLDSSAEMIRRARRREIPGRLSFVLADVGRWSTDSPFDLILSNACLHWIADHERLLGHLVGMMARPATLAFQVPANHDRPSHTILAELCASPQWREVLADAHRVHVRPPDWYAEQLRRSGFRVTAWQSTYLHQLEGRDPVLEWVRGSALRPVLDRLDDKGREAFLADYGARLRTAYPERDGITVFPFTRTFIVAVR